MGEVKLIDIHLTLRLSPEAAARFVSLRDRERTELIECAVRRVPSIVDGEPPPSESPPLTEDARRRTLGFL